MSSVRQHTWSHTRSCNWDGIGIMLHMYIWASVLQKGAYDMTSFEWERNIMTSLLSNSLFAPSLNHLNNEKLEWGCPNGTNTPRGNQFKLSTFLTPISVRHILDSQGICAWSLMIADVKGKQLCATKNSNHCIVTLTFDLLTLTPIGHTLHSSGVFVWSFMMIGVKGKQLCAINHFQKSMNCDLDLWPFDPEVNRAHPWLMGNVPV